MFIEKEKLIKMYETMTKIRKFEEKTKKLFTQGLIRGPFHPYIGEEATAAGVCLALNIDDYITSTHRGHGHCIAKGGDVNRMMAELLGKVTGYCKGKGGSMHIADMDIGILGANGIVGGGFNISTGAALSIKMRNTNQVAVCFFGDGAANQGTFNEGLNMASIWKLPVVFVCENNQYGLTSKAKEVLSVKNVADRAQGYSMPSEIVDGNDVLEVYKAAQSAVTRARKGEGPGLIEAKTYRIEGHFVGDPNRYRPREEIEEWKKRCPIIRFRKYLISNKYLNEEEIKEIDNRIQEEIDKAEIYAKESPEPSIDQLTEDIFA